MTCLQTIVLVAGLLAVHAQFYQSHIELTTSGFEVQPRSPSDQLETFQGILDITSCAFECNQKQLCRYFDYITSTAACRIFLDGTVVASPAPTAQVGIVMYMADLYSSYGQPCTWVNCQINRYLTCDSANTCQCPTRLFWDGTICAPTTITTTTTRTTTTTPATVCTTSGPANLLSASGSFAWTAHSINYVATNLAPLLSFAIHNGPAAETTYLDDVSVVDTSAPSVQLLSNPSFENSTSGPTGWTAWCTSSCAGSGDGYQITTTGCHPSSGINCLKGHCQTGYGFIGQSFSATVGHNYTISFWLYKTGGAAGMFYANIQ